MKNLIKSIIFSFCLILVFTSCYFFYTAEDNYILVDSKYYLFKDYDSMCEVAPALINSSFTEWHLNSNKFKQKLEKYYGNIDIHTYSVTELNTYSDSTNTYNYCIYKSSGETFSSGTSSISISGTFFVITDKANSISTVFYLN